MTCLSERTLRQKTISGIFWTLTTRGFDQLLRFILIIFLARLLNPEDFGLLAMVLVLTGFARIVGEFGFGAALIQRETITENHKSSIFWINVSTGLFLTLFFNILSAPISKFYGEPKLQILTSVISIVLFISTIQNVHISILKREMYFRKLGIIQLFSVLVSGFAAILLAYQGLGIWSLVFQTILGTLMSVIVVWITGKWYPKWIFDKKSVRELLGFSSNLVGFSVIRYWIRNADNVLVGKYIGATELGIYSRAYSMMLLPVNQITNLLSPVMFSALSKIQNDNEHFKRVYLRAIAIIAMVTFPIMVGLFITANYFVLALFGEKWRAVVPILKILCVVGLIQSILGTVAWIFQSLGKTDWMFQWSIISDEVTPKNRIIYRERLSG